MKYILLSVLALACTFGSAALIAKPKTLHGSNQAQSLCMPGDTAKTCWQYLEHRRY